MKEFKKLNSMLLSILFGAGLIFVSASTPVTAGATSAPRFEPPDGQTYFGFTYRTWDGPALTDPGYGDIRPFAERFRDSIQVELAGKRPTLHHLPTIWQQTDGTYVPFSAQLAELALVEAAAGVPIVPFISWNAQTGWENSNPNYLNNPNNITTRTINQGRQDAYIRQYARDIKAYAKPVFIRSICGEFNGSWWKSCSPRANPALTTQDFVQAWRRIVDIFNQEGVTNVAWVWTPAVFPPPPEDWGIDQNIGSYYPGDEYVDWAGGDHYDYGPPSFLDPLYSFAVAHGKPFFLAEWGVRHDSSTYTPSQDEQWLRDMFNYVETHSKMKAIVYFNLNMNYEASCVSSAAPCSNHIFLYNGKVNYRGYVRNNDFRLLAESGANFRGTFAGNIAKPRYVSTLTMCSPLNFVGGSVSPSTVSTGKPYTISCNYGEQNGCVYAAPGSGNCFFNGWNGMTANFSCTAGTTPGTYSAGCSLGTCNNHCAQTNTFSAITVQAQTPLSGSCSYTPTSCVPGSSGVNFNWYSNDTNLNGDCGGYKFQTGNGTGGVPNNVCPASNTTCTFTSATGKTGSFSCKLTTIPGSSVNVLSNPGMETDSGGTPAGWSAAGNNSQGTRTFTRSGPGDAASGSYSARLKVSGVTPSTTGSIWIVASPVVVQGKTSINGNVYIRSSAKNIRIFVNEYNSSGTLLKSTSTASYNPGAWQWDSFESKAGRLNMPLLSNTYKVVFGVLADIQGANSTNYLDIDNASLFAN